jgi:hypothetical protein
MIRYCPSTGWAGADSWSGESAIPQGLLVLEFKGPIHMKYGSTPQYVFDEAGPEQKMESQTHNGTCLR